MGTPSGRRPLPLLVRNLRLRSVVAKGPVALFCMYVPPHLTLQDVFIIPDPGRGLRTNGRHPAAGTTSIGPSLPVSIGPSPDLPEAARPCWPIPCSANISLPATSQPPPAVSPWWNNNTASETKPGSTELYYQQRFKRIRRRPDYHRRTGTSRRWLAGARSRHDRTPPHPPPAAKIPDPTLQW